MANKYHQQLETSTVRSLSPDSSDSSESLRSGWRRSLWPLWPLGGLTDTVRSPWHSEPKTHILRQETAATARRGGKLLMALTLPGSPSASCTHLQSRAMGLLTRGVNCRYGRHRAAMLCHLTADSAFACRLDYREKCQSLTNNVSRACRLGYLV